MAVRTLNIAHGNKTASGQLALFTVPSDRTLIVKDARLVNASGSTMDIGLVVIRSGVEASILPSQPVASIASLELLDAFVVLQAEDQLRLYSSADPVQYIVSGALLAGEAA